MKLRHLLLLFFLTAPLLLLAQAGQWTWVSGVSFTNNTGTFGTRGVPNVNNSPPSLYEACEWKDHAGNFWLFGGLFYNGLSSTAGDLWRYNPLTNEWTWMTGTSVL